MDEMNDLQALLTNVMAIVMANVVYKSVERTSTNFVP